MPGRDLNLLSLDGGGVRGLSSLYILQRIMNAIDPDNPPKPCDYFDVIGGTSTGGLIAIMLGRLDMSVDECIKAYTELSATVFHKKHRIPVNIKGNLKERYDSKVLEQAIKQIIRDRNLDENTLLKDPQGTKVFVCCTSGETSQTSLLRSWYTSRGDPDLYRTVRIWEAARATSAASSFFDSISIGDPQQRFLDGGTGANNPVQHVWDEAADLLTSEESLSENVGCLISLGTGQPGYKPFEDTILGIGKTLLSIATETEASANRFHRSQSRLFEKKLCFRFNVPRGLGDVGLAEVEQIAAIKSMTADHLQSEATQSALRSCVERLQQRQSHRSKQKSALLLESIKQAAQDDDEVFQLISQNPHWQLAGTESDSLSLLGQISDYQPQRSHHKIKMLKVTDTTEWIIKDRESFVSWLTRISTTEQPNQNCLWISGIIGCGKTFLVNTVVQFLIDRHDQHPSLGSVAHVYFDPDKRDTSKATYLFQSYVKQLLRHLHASHQVPPDQVILALRRMSRSGFSNQSSKEIVQDLLIPLIRRFKRMFLVVDGLDLCSRLEYRSAFICFESILKETHAKIIICGRDELDVENRLPGSLRLQVTAAKNRGDIAKFVEHQVKERSTFDGPISNNEKTVARVVDTLIDKANGMFLWARLQIDVLWDTCSTDEAIDRALLDLPKDLDETYERCLKRLQKKQEPYALRVIGYVYEARSPLTVEALGEALATNPTTGILLHKQIPPYRFIVECGANLIVFDSERLVVPAHHSVRQFLEGSIAEVLNQLKSNTPQPTLGEICIAHLCWHMELAIEEGAQNPRKIETTSLRMPSISTMSRWKQPHNIISYLRKPSLLWAKKPVLASGSNNAPVVIQRLAIKPKVLYTVGPFQQYARSSWLTFSWPVAHRSELCTRFWELVLQQSADPQLCPWIDGPTRVVQTSDIMWWAIDNSHELLFDMAVHQLSMAKSTVRQSLARLDFNSPLSDYEGLLPLHLAAKQGSLTIFTRVMTMESVDVTSTNSATGWTALHYAVRYGQSEIVKCLLESDPSSMLLRGHDGHSPLCLAIVACSFVTIKAMEAIYGHQAWWGEDVFTLLDALGVNQIDSDLVDHVLWRITSFIEHSHSKVLAWVVKQGDVNLLASAIKAGVSPDTRISSKDLGTGGNLVGDREEIVCEAIFFALEASSPDLALAFIRNGANRKVYTIQNQEYWEPLTLALVRGWISLALLVSDHASNPDRHLMVSFSMSVTGPDVAWFSILATHGGVITSTNFNFLPRKNLVVSEHVMFWRVDTGGVGGTYEMRVNMSSEKSPWPYVGFRLIVGATDTQPTAWRSRPAAKMRRRAEVKIVWRGRQRLFNFELNPYSMQHLQLDHGDITLVDGRPF